MLIKSNSNRGFFRELRESNKQGIELQKYYNSRNIRLDKLLELSRG